MSDRKKVKTKELLNEAQAAEFLGISMSWLRASRTKNPAWAGPTFIKRDGWKIQYRRSDLVAFRKMRQARTSVVHPAKRIGTAAQGKGAA